MAPNRAQGLVDHSPHLFRVGDVGGRVKNLRTPFLELLQAADSATPIRRRLGICDKRVPLIPRGQRRAAHQNQSGMNHFSQIAGEAQADAPGILR